MAVADVVVLMALRQSVLWQLKDDCDQYEQLLDNVFSDLALECLDLLPMLVHYVRMSPFQLRNCAMSTPEGFYITSLCPY